MPDSQMVGMLKIKNKQKYDARVYGHLVTNEIATKKSTRHQRITLQ